MSEPLRTGLPEALSTPFGGPRGRLAGPPRARYAALAPLVLASAAPIALGVLRQDYCLNHGWGGNRPLYRGCYSDVLASMQTGHLGDGLVAYLAGRLPLPEPPLSGAALSLVAGLAPGTGVLGQQRWFVALWALLALILTAAMALLVATTRDHPRRNAAYVALSPVLGLVFLLGSQIVAATLVAAGIWAWTRERPRLPGALLALAVLAGWWPVLVVIAIALLGGRPLREFAIGAGAALLATAVFFLASPGTLVASIESWWTGPVGNGSPFYLLTLLGNPVPPGVGSGLAALGWALAVSLGYVVVRESPRRPTVAQVALILLAVVLVTGKSFPLQASLALVPLVALAGVPWRPVLVWLAAEAVHYAALWLHVSSYSTPNHALPGPWYSVALLLRVASIIWLARSVWVEVLPPEDEPVAPTWPADEAGATDAVVPG